MAVSDMLNFIWQNSSADYQALVGLTTNSNLPIIGKAILEYDNATNEFMNNFVNKIVMQLFNDRIFQSPLGILKKGSLDAGYTIEENDTNPVEGKDFSDSNDALFTAPVADTVSVYHNQNRVRTFPLKVSYERLQTAFLSNASMMDFVNYCVNQIYNGDYIEEYEWIKNIINLGTMNNEIMSKSLTAVTDEATAKNFVRVARQDFTNFTIPSTSYNSYKMSGINGTGKARKQFCSKDDIVLIVNSNVNSYTDVEVLAKAFNISNTSLLGQQIIVDDFGDNSAIQAVLADKNAFKFYDTLRKLKQFENGANLTWSYWLHVRQILSLSPFLNMVAYTSNLASAISLNKSTETIVKDATLQLTATTTPTGLAVGYYSEDITVATVSSTGLVTGVGTGTTNIVSYVKNNLAIKATCALTVMAS